MEIDLDVIRPRHASAMYTDALQSGRSQTTANEIKAFKRKLINCVNLQEVVVLLSGKLNQ